MPDCRPGIKNLRKYVHILKYISISFPGLERSVQRKKREVPIRSPLTNCWRKQEVYTEGVFILTSRTPTGLQPIERLQELCFGGHERGLTGPNLTYYFPTVLGDRYNI